MGKVINLDLILNGKQNGLDDLISKVGELGNALMQAGALVDQLGSHVRDLENDSLEIYKNYETYMLEAKGALSAQYASASELDKVMDGLDKSAREWASTTIFHTDDVSKAISEAAHAGWSYEQMLEGIPNAMLLAQAGNIDLSTGLDYLIKTLNGTGTAFEDSQKLVDQWVMAANSSATTVSELGEAFLRMGSTARFADNNAELLAMLGALADAGTVGAQAGTLLRNGMIRLIAPTDKASAAMHILGASAEEIEDALTNQSVTKAAKQLDALGFSAFDANGELKPMLQIFHELNDATKDLTEQSKDELLSAIFPTRTITGALAILDAMEKIDELYEKINDSDGYAQKVADIQMSGLMGSQEEFLSKWEEFENKIGATLAPKLEHLYELGGGLIDKVNSLDPVAMEALVGGMSTLASLGPLLMGTGIALKLFSALGPVGTTALLAAMGINALAASLKKIDEMNFEGKFGTLNADLTEVGEYVDSLDSKFKEQQAAISEWSGAIAEAQSTYQSALSQFSEQLLIDTLTSKQLTDQDIQKLSKLGEDIINATFSTAENAEARDQSFLSATLGDVETNSEALAYRDATAWVDVYYQTLEKKIEDANKRLKELISGSNGANMSEAMRQEYTKVLSELAAYNAEMSGANRRAEYETELIRASQVSWNTAESFLKSNAEKLESQKDAVNELYAQQLGYYKVAYEEAAKNGNMFQWTDSAGNKVTVDTSEKSWANVEENLRREWKDTIQGEVDNFGNVAAAMVDALFNDSSASDAWKVIKKSNENGARPFDEYGNLKDGFNLEGYDAGKVADSAYEMAQMWGRMSDLLEPYADNPRIDAYLDYMQQALSLWQYAGDRYAQESTAQDMQEMEANYSERQAEKAAADAAAKRAAAYEEETRASQAHAAQVQELQGKAAKYQQQVETLTAKSDSYATQIADLTEQLENHPPTATGLPQKQLQQKIDELTQAKQSIDEKLEASQEKLAAVQEQIAEISGEPINIEADTTSATAAIDELAAAAESANPVMTVTANTEGAAAQIAAVAANVPSVTIPVSWGDPGPFPYSGETIPVSYESTGGSTSSKSSTAKAPTTANSLKSAVKSAVKSAFPALAGLFEEGGRTDEPAIFGEGETAEWAIPEAHTSRTAELLDMTRKASGFTWPELLARTGGLNADTTGVHVTIGSYAPVIHAENVNGVEKALLEDKKRLEAVVKEAVNSALNDRSMRDSVEVYV